MRIHLWCGVLAWLALGGCQELPVKEDGGVPEAPPVQGAAWYRPGVGTTWQLQLTGTVNTAHAADLYIIDLFDSSPALIAALQATGRKVICYFSAGSYENWRSDAWRYAGSDLGNTLSGYPDERWVDIRSANVRAILFARMDLAVSKGCDGVDPDNVDGYTNNTGFPLTAQHQLDFNAALANAAHERGLAVSLKNDIEQIGALLPYFDFAVNESCHVYNECHRLAPVIAAGKPVFNVEYESKYVTSSSQRAALCADAQARQFRTLMLPVQLNDAYRYTCD